MIYIENVYICLAAPLLIAILCLKDRKKIHMVFLLSGMTACIFSSYITTWMAVLVGAGHEYTVVEIAPFVEEVVKLSPILFYLLLVHPPKDRLTECVLMVSVGFATFENVCYLLNNGSEDLLSLLIRGFGTGAMHVVCGVIVSAGIIWLWDNPWLRFIGTVALLSVAITYHGIFNILVSHPGASLVIGGIIPVLTMCVVIIEGTRRRPKDEK